MAKKQKNAHTTVKRTGQQPAPRKSKAVVPRQAKPSTPPQQRPLGALRSKPDELEPFVVRGIVSDTAGSPAVGLTVIAFDQDIGGEDRLGEATTDAKGAFRITYSAARFRRSPKERGGADVFVRVYSAKDVLLFQSKTKRNAPANFWLDVQLPAAQCVVRGAVRLADGTPLADALVRAYDKDLRTEEQLGEPTTTDKDGRYEIAYAAGQFARAENDSADLLVEARQKGQADWVAAPIRFNARPIEIIDVTLDGIYRGPPEFRRLVDTITPLLDGLTMAQLTEDAKFQDITFLSNDTGIDRKYIAWLATSALRAQEEDVLQQEEYYGLFRQDLPTDLDALLGEDTETLRAALENSARDNIVRAMSPQALDEFAARVLQLKAGRALHPGGENEPASLGDLLAVSVDSGKHEAIAKLFVENGGASEAFWTALGKESSLKPDEVPAVKRTLALGTLTENHLPLVQALYQMGKENATFADLQGFAQLDEADWQALLRRPRDPTDPNSQPIGFPPGQESIESYARILNQSIEQAYPTAVISNRLGRDNADDSPFKESKGDLLTFFSNNPAFSFTASPPGIYLKDHADEKLREVKNPDELRATLKSMQRVFNLTPRFAEIRGLLADNLHSATAVVRVGKRGFVEKYAGLFGGNIEASGIYDKAKHVNDASINIYIKNAEAFNLPMPYVISGGARTVTTPDYDTLFGSLDVCDCPHCQSLYGPSAYLADILKFLADGPTKNDVTPLQVLLGQRPDLEHIELACDNTDIELPYVDLTNEILEAAVVPRSFEFAEDSGVSGVLASLNAEQLPSWIKTAFANNGYVLSAEASVRNEAVVGVTTPSNWILLDRGWAFTLKHMGTNEGFLALAWPQTSWTAGELRAMPEHVHAPAYTILQGAVYPWNLPLNLPLEEMRGYLDHLGGPRDRLIDTLFPSSTSDIALEYLRLSPEEANIITGVTTGGPGSPTSPSGAWDFWGLRSTGNDLVDQTDGTAPHAQGDWDVVLQRVSIFLQQSGLGYKELLELLGTQFINPTASAGTPGGRVLGIVSNDASDPTTCNLSKLEIQVVDPTMTAGAKNAVIEAWGKMHRFVRLWRKLGWTIRDLDKAFTAQPRNNLGQVDLNALFLEKLSAIQRLHADTGLPVLTLLSWWANIDTAGYIDHLADGEPTVASLYATLFNNKTVSGQVVGEDPASLSGTVSDKAAAIAAALQVSVEEVALLQATLPNDHLSLSNLSLLYRQATLAGALGLPIRTYLTALALVDPAPFASTANTLQFKKHIEMIGGSGFTIEDLDYLLRDEVAATSDLAATDDVLATTLEALRDDLRKVAADNTFVETGVDDLTATSDPNGDLTRKKLALLNWDPALIESAIAVLNDTFAYEATLPSLAAGIQFPDSLKGRISYDRAGLKLRLVGTMTGPEQALLFGLHNADTAFVTAVGDLFAAPKAFVARNLARFSPPVFSAAVTGANLRIFLAQVKFPEVLKGRIYYDSVASTLCFVGIMTEAERGILSELSSDNEYLMCVQTLYAAPDASANAPTGADLFLTSSGSSNDAAALFDTPDTTPPARFLLVLKKLLPHLRATLSELAVKQRLGEYLKLDATSIDGLLTKWVKPQVVDPADPGRMAIADFLDPAFAESSADIAVSKDAFPRQFRSLRLLSKIAIVVLRFNITFRQLRWLFESPAAVGWLDLNALPIAGPGAATSLYQGWERLADLFRLRDALPHGEALLSDIFAAATRPGAQVTDVLTILSDGTQWDLESLKSLSGPNVFNFSADAFAGESAILLLSAAIKLLKRLGASADQCLPWAKVPPTDEDARGLKSLVRSKYDDTQWLDLTKLLRDPLRERQRSALVAYLVQKLGARDADDLHDRYLIDVEMSPCMMTTRIKQAISSVQLFIQRCLMNLDADVALTPTEAQEWSQWRKWYRVWEANRKVLFYPENWLEPELRDDKSPFYKDLESELLQSDVTTDTAEDAFLHYLEKLDQVARLEIVGMYHQQEPGDIALQLEAVDILHVFGRTFASPHVYFCRQLADGIWSAWEKVDLDIEGDHLIPVIWNRRVHLFWPTFTEKSDPLTKEQRANNEDPTKYWEINFAWSEYRNNRWSSKKVSREFLRYDKEPPSADSAAVPQKPEDFSFKTRIVQGTDGEQLSIECYGTTVVHIMPPPVDQRSDTGPISEEIRLLTLVHGNSSDPYPARVVFTINGKTPWKGQGEMIQTEIRDTDGHLLESLTLDENGRADFGHPVDQDVRCFLVSDEFAISKNPGSVTLAWDGNILTNTLNVEVDLEPRVQSSVSQGLTGESTRPSLTYKLMQGIGEFRLDDANGDLAATPAAPPLQSLDPVSLDPIGGTEFQGMAMVEYQNATDTLGHDAVFGKTPGAPFRLLFVHQYYVAHKFSYPFFFQDDRHTYFAFLQKVAGSGIGGLGVMLRFSTFYHGRIHDLITALNRQGVDGLLTLETQRLSDDASEFQKYAPNPTYVDESLPESLPREDVDFEYPGAYSLYNWELFFHAPFLIATQLGQNQRFEEAQKWFHYIFDPTATDSPAQPDHPGPERFWRVKPFYEAALQPVQTLDALITDAADMEQQIDEWRANPFKPYVIARLRIVAYMKAVVMRYIDNLVAWGDQLFRRDTIESINEATQLYILAAQILGRRPDSIPARATPKIQTFRTLDDIANPDDLSNAIVEIESFLAPSVAPPLMGTQSAPPLTIQYFCIPGNDKLLGYWDTVADRLFKIRHCMNIEGVERTLPVFEPPIDPELLVRAAAAGVDIASALNDMNAALPHYRFRTMLLKASELCSEVKALGGAMLSALEKRDAEALAMLRSGHEVELLKAVRQIKAQQVDEANDTLEGLSKYQDVVTARQQYYLSRPFMNPFEIGHLALAAGSLAPMTAQLGAETTAAALHLIPDTKVGAPPTDGVTYGGSNIGSAVQAFGGAAGVAASLFNTMASLSATLGGYQRRQEDWDHQADLATKELLQVAKQIAAAEVRLAISQHELENHDLQIENAKEADDFMRDKYTNQELYQWMVGQLSAIFFQSYQLAYDVAKRAERAYCYELGLQESDFIQFGYWDSLKKGLLSGERLQLDLRRMDQAYLDQNKREYEITKHVSMLSLDPAALIKLRETAQCEIAIPEELFDLECPGHYLRRIKSVSVTLPCVTGPYVGVNCTLTLLKSSVRSGLSVPEGYARNESAGSDSRFVDSFGAIQSVVTSSGQNDSGLFETNLNDERYLPFEGAGAISNWRVELPSAFRPFDYASIADVILHVRYTARDGGAGLKQQVITELQSAVNQVVTAAGDTGLGRLVSLRYEYPTEWNHFRSTPAAGTDNELTIDLGSDRFPFMFSGRTVSVDRVDLFIKVKPDFVATYTDASLKTTFALGPVAPTSGNHTAADLLSLTGSNGLLYARKSLTPSAKIPPSATAQWTLDAWFDDGSGPSALDAASLEDVMLVFHYTI